ncbi:hypothetical protein TCAL_16010 [Tigriopus californicus]|uniref:Uncharacterized protein n=1 Tax=Tigriopus californicus TaxID=6832 RepID=A0A553PQL1_TIGCA|nr:uncharacterized protein LOC131881556 [Tigriopus californicus]TRY79964.1 hypothetical protein TCAL_16010 [Tigriopus californicus]
MKLALTTLTFTLLVTAGQCLKCYSGSGSFSSSFSEKECASTEEWCMKSKTGVSIATVETRGCFSSASNDAISNACQSVDVAGIGTETCYCNTDLCNGAQGARPIIGMAMALISIGVYFVI